MNKVLHHTLLYKQSSDIWGVGHWVNHSIPEKTKDYKRQLASDRTDLTTRARKIDLNIATWNVKTMLESGKIQEVANELEKLSMDITAVKKLDAKVREE